MNELDKLHKEFDNNDWDATNDSEINKAFQLVNEKLIEENDLQVYRHSEIERQAFAFSKSPESRLSYKLAGDKILEDGTTIPYEWPDINTFNEEDFNFLLERFRSSSNQFSITEYGLVLYYSGRLKSNEEVYYLLYNLFKLSNRYISAAKNPDTKKYYIHYYTNVLNNAFHIASNRKGDQKIGEIYKDLINFSFRTHQEWDITHQSGLRSVLDLTDLAIQYFKDFKEIVNLHDFVAKNWQAAIFLSQTYIWGAIYVTDITVRLLKKMKVDTNSWLQFKAQQYEKLYVESREEHNMAAVSFIEKAMSIYKSLKDQSNLKRLERLYQQVRNEFELGEVKIDMPQDEIQRIAKQIQKVVMDSSEQEIIKTLMLTPMIMPLDSIYSWSKDSFKQSMLQNMFPTNIQDKFGNTIASFNTEEEKEKFAFLKNYDFHFQIALQSIVQLFMEAFRAEKISAKSTINFLSESWYNIETRKVYGREIQINNLALLESGIKSLFQELDIWKSEQGYLPNFVSATDSLILKIEFILREFAIKIGKSTFKPKANQPEIIMEKTLDDLLKDLESDLDKDDHYFIKFILTEKAGYNLRNRIAHGLMDSDEYSIQCVILALIILLKLSNYQFTNK